jgi:hypothetical protein
MKCGVKPSLLPALFKLPTPLEAFEDEVLNWWAVSDKRSPLFQGKTFEIREPHEAALTAVIVAHRGVVSRRANAVLVVPHGGFVGEDAREQVTANWILACAGERRLLAPTDGVLFRPMKFRLPLAAVAGRRFALLGLRDDLRPTIADIARTLGGVVMYRRSGAVDFVVAFAAEEGEGAPPVTPQFVIQIAMTGEVPDWRAFRASTPGDPKRIASLCITLKANEAWTTAPSSPVTIDRTDLENFSSESEGSSQTGQVEIGYATEVPTQSASPSMDGSLLAIFASQSGD